MNKNTTMKISTSSLVALCLLLSSPGTFAVDKSKLEDQSQIPSNTHKVGKTQYFIPPSDSELQNNAFGELVRRGEAIFVNTKALAPQFVGNEMNCVNCHIDRGRLANSSPMWAAYPMYPAYRKKNNKVNTYAERLQGCFTFSMNGTPPPADSEVILALTAYSYWLSTGAPVGKALPGRGFDEPPPPKGGYDIARGKVVYEKQCQICHGSNGEGQKVGATYVFPPLWGKNSYNWGAGMHRINTAAGFIQHNMPLGRGETLSDVESWDVAAFINMHERPQDPRIIDGDIEKTRKRFHADDGVNLYGSVVDGVLIGKGVK
ncbi:c-type cytochrome [Polynucleobacter sp. JS-Safj-400b-B2]|uniref:c-type cytochrome n=1 Tax=Polynucleobacter sp. JS-Safj-400b-B2 TaxID=2576921 RepID=UPI002102AD67|nr:c-type cytochrome [Polynucleobacter sp. JS-Safj-400b-B2]